MPNTNENTSGKALANIIQSKDNFCLASPPRMVTYLHHIGTRSLLDLCFCSANILSYVTVTTGPCLGSDHLPLTVGYDANPVLQPVKNRQRLKTKNVQFDVWRKGLPAIEWQEDREINYANEHFHSKVLSSIYEIRKLLVDMFQNIARTGGMLIVPDL